MRFFSFTTGGDLGLGVFVDDKHVDVSRAVMHEFGTINLQELIEFHEINDVVNFIEDGKIEPEKMPAEYEFLPPIMKPGKILAVLQNYKKHAAEFGNTPPTEPVWFGKVGSSMTGHGHSIEIPSWVDGRVDHEVELGVIIASPCKEIAEDAAMEHVAGYTIINDVSARRIQKHDRENRHPWLRCKNFDTFTPMGPYFVPKKFIDDPHKLKIFCRVNHETKQDASTSEMVHSVAKIISTMSRWTTLLPADIIATGTPEGVYNLRDKDICECEIEGLGVLRNPVSRPTTT